MFIKPPKKIKRLLRVRLLHEKHTKENILKIIGAIEPPEENKNSLKFTSFVRQVAFSYSGESQPFEVVLLFVIEVEKARQRKKHGVKRWNCNKASEVKLRNSFGGEIFNDM